MPAAKKPTKTVKVTSPYHHHEDGRAIQQAAREMGRHNDFTEKSYRKFEDHMGRGQEQIHSPKTMEKGFDNIRKAHEFHAAFKEHDKAATKHHATLSKMSSKFLKKHYPVGSKVVHEGKQREVIGHATGHFNGEPHVELKGVTRTGYLGMRRKKVSRPRPIHVENIQKIVE